MSTDGAPTGRRQGGDPDRSDPAAGGEAPVGGGPSGCDPGPREWVGPPADASIDDRVMAGMGSGTQGVLITVEGVDGSGKSTQLSLLADALSASGYDVLTTREPGGTPVGEAVRKVLLDADHTTMTARTEALLYAAARAQLVEEVLRPALDDGLVVLCDRYLDSSLAYQGYGRGLVTEDVLMLNVWATECLFPDLTLVIDVDEPTRAARMGEPVVVDRLEAEDSAFFDRVAEGYRRLAADHRHRVVLIDGDGTAEAVAERVRAAVERELRLFSCA